MDEYLFENYLESSSSLSTISSDTDLSRNQKKPAPEEIEKKQKSLYKTELCRNWEESSHCRYGTKCQYAHGTADLREIDRHPKYKTQKCRTFHQTGSCPYGSRCTFRHFNLPGDDQVKSFNQHWLLGQVNTFENDDSLLPSNAESLLPHQLLFDLESPPNNSPLRRCPLRNYVNLPTFSQLPQQEKSFFHPWLI